MQKRSVTQNIKMSEKTRTTSLMILQQFFDASFDSFFCYYAGRNGTPYISAKKDLKKSLWSRPKCILGKCVSYDEKW